MPKPKAELVLPWPPSVNGYWRSFKGRNILSKRARSFQEAAALKIESQGSPSVSGSVAIRVTLSPPDKGERRDLDNYGKATLDALEKNGVIESDSKKHLKELHFCWGDVIKGGLCAVSIWTAKDA